MSESTDADGDSDGLNVTHEKTVYQEETIKVRSQRGTGTNDRDTVSDELVRKAELDVEEADLPDLIGADEALGTVAQVAQVMEAVRETNQDD